MAKHPFSHQPPYFYGMTDMYMQMGFYPYPGQTAEEHPDANVGIPLPMAMAMQCKYYLGQTEPLTAGAALLPGRRWSIRSALKSICS